MVEDRRVRRPRSLVSLSTAAAAVLVAGVVVAAQAGDARPGGVHATAATPSATPSSTPGSSGSTIDPQLTAAIKAKLSQSTSSSYAAVVDVEGLGQVVNINGARSMLPASTEKLFTALPMLLNRAQQQLVTTIGTTAAPSGGVVHGVLVVQAAADPTLMGMEVVRFAQAVH